MGSVIVGPEAPPKWLADEGALRPDLEMGDKVRFGFVLEEHDGDFLEEMAGQLIAPEWRGWTAKTSPGGRGVIVGARTVYSGRFEKALVADNSPYGPNFYEWKRHRDQFHRVFLVATDLRQNPVRVLSSHIYKTRREGRMENDHNHDLFQPPMDPLEVLRERSGEGSTCECCGSFMKLYKRPLGSYARILIWMARNTKPGEFIRIADAAVPRWWDGGGDYGKLRHWGLIEADTTTPDPSKKTTGYWRLTEAGRDFAMGRSLQPSHCYVDHPGQKLRGFETTERTIVDALGDHFNYNELMRGGV